jgi:hypothetical protein
MPSHTLQELIKKYRQTREQFAGFEEIDRAAAGSPSTQDQLNALAKQLFSVSGPIEFEPINLPKSKIIQRQPLPGESVRTSGAANAELEPVQGPVFTNFVPSGIGTDTIDEGLPDDRLITSYGPSIVDIEQGTEEPLNLEGLIRGLAKRVEEGPEATTLQDEIARSSQILAEPQTGRLLRTGFTQEDLVNDPFLFQQYEAENNRRAELRGKFQEATIKAYTKTVQEIQTSALKTNRSLSDTIINADWNTREQWFKRLNTVPKQHDLTQYSLSELSKLLDNPDALNNLPNTLEFDQWLEKIIALIYDDPKIEFFLAPATRRVLQKAMEPIRPEEPEEPKIPFLSKVKNLFGDTTRDPQFEARKKKLQEGVLKRQNQK